MMQESLEKSAKSVHQKSAKRRGILDSATAAKRFTLKRYAPSSNLAAFIEHYWTVHWDLQAEAPYIAQILPYPNVDLAFAGEQSWITGVVTGTYEYELKGTGTILGVTFKPGAFYAFWPHPMVQLTDKTLPAGDVFDGMDASFCHALLELGDDRRMVVRVEELLYAKKPVLDRNMRTAAKIIEAIANDTQLRTVRAVAEQFVMSERTLQHLFRTYVGVGLKWVIMRYRLQEAAELIVTQPNANWSTIAAELGYSDQPHFTNDFKRVIGKSPSDYATEAGGRVSRL